MAFVTIKIESDDAAVVDGGVWELADMVDKVAREIRMCGSDDSDGTIYDSNGNQVGEWSIGDLPKLDDEEE